MTSSQFRSHFLRQKKGRSQIGHVFCGRFLFFIARCHLLIRNVASEVVSDECEPVSALREWRDRLVAWDLLVREYRRRVRIRLTASSGASAVTETGCLARRGQERRSNTAFEESAPCRPGRELLQHIPTSKGLSDQALAFVLPGRHQLRSFHLA